MNVIHRHAGNRSVSAPVKSCHVIDWFCLLFWTCSTLRYFFRDAITVSVGRFNVQQGFKRTPAVFFFFFFVILELHSALFVWNRYDVFVVVVCFLFRFCFAPRLELILEVIADRASFYLCWVLKKISNTSQFLRKRLFSSLFAARLFRETGLKRNERSQQSGEERWEEAVFAGLYFVQ